MSAKKPTVGILLYGIGGQGRDAFTEDKYRLLAEKVASDGFVVKTLAYHAARQEIVRKEAFACDAVLTWINPTEPELDRAALDAFLRELDQSGVLVSAHPDSILKLGTKDVLVTTQTIGWSVEACAYRSLEEFQANFPARVRRDGTRVLKQYRGHSGQGVWKITAADGDKFEVTPAAREGAPQTVGTAALIAFFQTRVFASGSHLVDQAWVPTITRGMVRAYLCGKKVVGFGYQEINALYPATPGEDFTRLQPSRRHYYTEQCALFQPLRQRLEQTWLPALAQTLGLGEEDFPLLWDTDFFFGDAPQDYLLCEINVSCVSPFPESAIMPIIREMKCRLDRASRMQSKVTTDAG
jgi:hypothetical protein